jgi:hypothetical protein
MPILGIIASQNYPRITNSYESIATTTVGSGGSATITFSSIPSTYKHLQIRGIARDASSNGEWKIEFNSDTTTTNYRRHGVYGDGSSAYAFGVNNNTVAPVSYSGQTTSVFGGYVTDILDYANTNKNKTVRTLGGYDVNGSGQLGLYSNLWNNTAAITSISLKIVGGSNFAQYTQFALYGVRA